MPTNVPRSRRSRCAASLLAAAFGLLLAGCTLTFSADLLQSLRLFFTVSDEAEAGAATLVGSFFFSEAVDARRRFVRVRGRLLPPAGGAAPASVSLVAETRDGEDKLLYRFKMRLPIAPDGAFQATKRFRRNLAAGSLMTVTVEPAGAAIAAGTEIELCVDLARRKGDFANADPCGSAGGAGPTTLAEIQRQIFTPSCARGGCHDAVSASEGLVLEAGRSFGELVGVPSNQVPFRLRVDPGRPDSSYLVRKLRGAADIQGVRMPLDGPPFLTDAELAGIEEWIRRGAANN